MTETIAIRTESLSKTFGRGEKAVEAVVDQEVEVHQVVAKQQMLEELFMEATDPGVVTALTTQNGHVTVGEIMIGLRSYYYYANTHRQGRVPEAGGHSIAS